VHLGSAVLHVDGETFLDFTALDDQVLQASLNEGTVNARVRELDPGENFEIDTPHLAFRASQPGDYRIDVDPARGTTRVTVRSGIALVYGAGGEAQQLRAGQQIAFAGRDLERVAVQTPPEDGFDRWAADRNRREDESVAARYVPREVVGYHQLDPYGTWAQDPSYGAVWFPRVVVADWAPYRYGHWEWISPWGWTWIDDAPWGFAPFHYGRWTVIGSRWCWVPGRIGPRPIYAPALVAFLGGGGTRSGWNLTIGSSPGIAWYPLAPGEAWRPAYRTSLVYVRNVNRNIFVANQSFDSAPAHVHRRRVEAVTALRVEDFSRGRPVHDHWRRVNPAEVARAPVATIPSMPEPPRRFGDAGRAATQPRMQPPARSGPPVTAVRPQPNFAPPGVLQREPGNRPAFRSREDFRAQEQPRRQDEQRPLMDVPRRQHERAPQVRQEERPRDEQRAQDEQRRQQVQQLRQQQLERARRDQQVQQERAQREQRLQFQAQRQQEEQRRAQQSQLQREHALRQQQAVQERLQRQQQAAQERQQQQQAAQERWQHQQREQLRQQQVAQERQQQHPPQQRQPQFVAPAAQPGPAQRGEWRERAAERGRQAQEGRGERRSQGDDDGRGRGHGYGRGG
jgi:flagellar biosynthesis GTPase FlhF